MSLPKCSGCGRFMRTHNVSHRIGWFRHGEHGSEEGWICSRCVKTWTPTDSRGRGPEAGYCGFIDPNPTPQAGFEP